LPCLIFSGLSIKIHVFESSIFTLCNFSQSAFGSKLCAALKVGVCIIAGSDTVVGVGFRIGVEGVGVGVRIGFEGVGGVRSGLGIFGMIVSMNFF
jgi:hypothetical protein